MNHQLQVLPFAVLVLFIFHSSAWGGQTVNIPRPADRLQPPPPPPPLEQSVVQLEVLVPAKELALDVDRAIPPVSAREDGWEKAAPVPGRDDVRFQYRFLRGPFQYQVNQDRLELKFDDIRYRMWVQKTKGSAVEEGRCGHGQDPPKRLRVAVHSALSWSETWHLRSKTTVDPPVFVDTCRLHEMDVDATPLLQSILQPRLLMLAEAIDRKVSERTEANQRPKTVWRKLQEPVPLTENRWLQFNVVDARVGQITSRGGLDVTGAVQLLMHPQIVSQKPSTPELPLPPLRTASVGPEGLRLLLPVFVEYARINKRLERALIGQTFDAPMGDPLKITGVELYGSGDKLIVALRVTGGVNGTLYAAGIPVFDEPSRSLRFTNLDFTIDTRNVVALSANQFWHDELLERLKSEVFVDLAEPLTVLQKQLNAALTRELTPGARLEGALRKLRPRGIYPVEGGVEVQLIAQGSMKLILE